MQMDEAWGNIPPHWAVYFAVADCAAMADKAALGGAVIRPPFAAGDVGTIAVLPDPQDATFMVNQVNAPDTTMP